MREMLSGVLSSGISPQLLLSDRDFTAEDYEALCRLDEKVENRKASSVLRLRAVGCTGSGSASLYRVGCRKLIRYGNACGLRRGRTLPAGG